MKNLMKITWERNGDVLDMGYVGRRALSSYRNVDGEYAIAINSFDSEFEAIKFFDNEYAYFNYINSFGFTEDQKMQHHQAIVHDVLESR